MATRRRSQYRWNEAAGQYIGPDGSFIEREVIRTELDFALKNADKRLRSLAMQLREDRVGLRAWRVQMRQLVKEIHLYSGAAAKGGWAQMSQADYGRVGRLLRDEYGYLDNFARELRAGYPMDGWFLQRTELYSQAGRETYDRVQTAADQVRGLDEERLVVDRAAEHCADCAADAALKWVKTGTLRPIGTRRCGRRCRCHKQRRRSKGRTR